MLQETLSKTDTAACAVFYWKVLVCVRDDRCKKWIIARLPGCQGRAVDAVSACTQVRMEDAPRLLRIPKSECPDILIRLP